MKCLCCENEMTRYKFKEYQDMTDEEILKAAGDWLDEGDDSLALDKIREALVKLKIGGSVCEYDENLEFNSLDKLIPHDCIIASFDAQSNCGEIIGIDLKKLGKIYENATGVCK